MLGNPGRFLQVNKLILVVLGNLTVPPVTLATRGLEEPFFPVVLLCQFSVLGGNRFWFYILFMYLEYHSVVVLC